MKTFRSEFSHSYETYSFGYANYCIREKDDNLVEIYSLGFLPYSGASGIKDTLYMARSARIPLKNFDLNSENRRIAKRFDNKFERVVTRLENFDTRDPDFRKLCLVYFGKRHGDQIMPEQRFDTILQARFITNIVTYIDNGKPIGYVFEVGDKKMSHFWFSFYNLDYVYKSLGMWLMIDAAREAKKSKKDYLYIGTVYDEKALYKNNFDGLEFWNGNEWIHDKKRLRSRAKSDKERIFDVGDEWKENLPKF